MGIRHAIQHQQEWRLVTGGQLGKKIILGPLPAFRNGSNNTLVDTGHPLIQLFPVHHFPGHPQTVKGIGNRLHPLVLTTGLNPDPLQPLRLSFQHGIYGMPAEYIFLRH